MDDYKVIFVFATGLILILSAFEGKRPSQYLREILKNKGRSDGTIITPDMVAKEYGAKWSKMADEYSALSKTSTYRSTGKKVGGGSGRPSEFR